MLTADRSYDGFYRHPGHAMSVGFHEQLLSDTYGGRYTSKGHTPEIEPKTNITHRKRVPVACERCRKRKIKCSGDQGDGSGCDNCKSAGWQGCQFLRVRSALVDYHPTISNNRMWHNQSAYHPYSRPRNAHHHHHHPPQSHSYLPQSQLSYCGWPESIDYPTMGTPNTTIPWSSGHYAPTYSVYDGENNSPYDSHPPSYMLPDPENSARSSVSCMSSTSRPMQSSVWLDQGHADVVSHPNSHISAIYPLTPVESTKSYSIFRGQAGQHPLSHERSILSGSLPTPTLTTTLPTIPSQNRDTPPLSAVSHRSSHTWNTDSSSHISNASSQTSCAGSQDLSVNILTTCEDQTVVYPYPAETASPQVHVLASALPIATDDHDKEQEQERQTSTPTTSVSQTSTDDVLNLHSCEVRERMPKASPTSLLYGYGNLNRSSRQPSTALPTRLANSCYTAGWTPLSGSSGNDSLAS